jgi:diguanylate cyclase (GGDEF)-like protein
MAWTWLRQNLGVGEISTPVGRTLVEERYLALRRQVPIIYVLAIANGFALQVTTQSQISLGLNLPTILLFCAITRAFQWLRASTNPPHSVMLMRMNQTCWLAALLCCAVSGWCLYLLETAASGTHMAIFLFGGFTAVGVAFGLSALPVAACVPLLVLALPLASVALRSPNPKFVGAAVSLAVVTVMILQLLARQSAQFTAIIRSRWMISHQQNLTEAARQDAIMAATTDFLTGLPNRRAFVAALAESAAAGQPFAVAVIDVDRFKLVNDTYGHHYGDELLRVVAGRLSKTAGESCLVARLGGDEFGLLLRHASTREEALDWGKMLLRRVSWPATLHRRKFAISASCGIGLLRDGEAPCPSRVFTDADVALYEAKLQSTDGVVVFEPRMEAPRQRRAQIENALQAPGVHKHIKVVFQPIVDLRSGRTVAHEALARWTDAKLGIVPPSEFVPIAEQLNVIGGISDRLMAIALAEVAHWHPAIRLSFNLSAIQLGSADLGDKVLAALAAADVRAERLQVEVTETALFADFARAKHNLAVLRSAGVTVVLDDFGAGYASIGYLREFQFDQIKLDGALLTSAVDSAEGERLLGAVIGLCRAIGVPTVAEHVESEQQLALLLKLGCNLGQGFWLQPPLRAEEAAQLCSQLLLDDPIPIGRAQRSAT